MKLLSLLGGAPGAIAANWRLALEAIAALAIAIVAIDAHHWHKQADRYEGLWHDEQKARAVEQQAVRDKTAAAHAADAAHVAAVGLVRTNISTEKVDDYRERLADLQRRYDALRVQPHAAPAAAPGGGGGAPMPGVPDRSGGADAGSAPDSFACAANTEQLRSLIGWVRDQAKVAN